jgi:hypothetical protein
MVVAAAGGRRGAGRGSMADRGVAVRVSRSVWGEVGGVARWSGGGIVTGAAGCVGACQWSSAEARC